MRFFKQGPHDGLCGFFAAINAIRFLQHQEPALSKMDDASFFNEAVECLARVPGCDLRIMKSDAAVGGIDPFQIRDLCILLAERIALSIEVRLANGALKLPFAARYRAALDRGDYFAFIVPYRDGSHWITALPHDERTYRLIDGGRASVCQLRGGDAPRLAADGVIQLSLARF